MKSEHNSPFCASILIWKLNKILFWGGGKPFITYVPGANLDLSPSFFPVSADFQISGSCPLPSPTLCHFFLFFPFPSTQGIVSGQLYTLHVLLVLFLCFS